jgi:hypothetical protein
MRNDSSFGIELSQNSDNSEPASDWLGPDSSSHIQYSRKATSRLQTPAPVIVSSSSAPGPAEPVPIAMAPALNDIVLKRPAAAVPGPAAKRSYKRSTKGSDAGKNIPNAAEEEETPSRESAEPAAAAAETVEDAAQELDSKLAPHLPPGKKLTQTHMGRRVPAGVRPRCGFRLFQVKMMWAKYTEPDKAEKSAEAIAAVEAIVEETIQRHDSRTG